MNKSLIDLRQLPRLCVVDDSITCKICGGTATFFDVVDFNKHCSIKNPYAFGLSGVAVKYYRCRACDFMFTNFVDDWSDSEFRELIYNDDYILVDPEYAEVRPVQFAKLLAGLLAEYKTSRILDYGSGSGKFSSEMKIHGYPYVDSYDPFSSPNRPEGFYDIITCFEVIEHSPNPIREFLDIAQFLNPDGGMVLASQSMQPLQINEYRCSWWYVAPRNGHVSTYSHFTFSEISKQLNFTYRSGILHAFHTHNPKLMPEETSRFLDSLGSNCFFFYTIFTRG